MRARVLPCPRAVQRAKLLGAVYRNQILLADLIVKRIAKHEHELRRSCEEQVAAAQSRSQAMVADSLQQARKAEAAHAALLFARGRRTVTPRGVGIRRAGHSAIDVCGAAGSDALLAERAVAGAQRELGSREDGADGAVECTAV